MNLSILKININVKKIFILFSFSATGARIGAESDLIWKFQRYNLIINFSNTLRLPPPLNVFSVLIIIYKFLRRCCRKGVSFLKKERKVEYEIIVIFA